MRKKRVNKYPTAFGKMALERLKSRRNATELAAELASRMKQSGINQLWVADITYIRLKAEFAYLAVILDAHSRKIGGLGAGSNPSNAVTPSGSRASESQNASLRLGASLRS